MNTKPYSRKLLVNVGIAKLALHVMRESGLLVWSMEQDSLIPSCRFLLSPRIDTTGKKKASQTYDKDGRNSIIVFSPILRSKIQIFITFEFGSNTKKGRSIIISLSMSILGHGGRKQMLLDAVWDTWQIGVDLITWDLRLVMLPNTR